eukprot:UN24858
MFELLKNSMRATCRHHSHLPESHLPEIKIIVVESDTDVTIKISDEGGGVKREDLDSIWNYFFTTCISEPRFLAGFGVGLPISRVHARYFGGDLEVVSIEKYGTDAFLYLSKLKDSDEYHLP